MEVECHMMHECIQQQEICIYCFMNNMWKEYNIEKKSNFVGDSKIVILCWFFLFNYLAEDEIFFVQRTKEKRASIVLWHPTRHQMNTPIISEKLYNIVSL